MDWICTELVAKLCRNNRYIVANCKGLATGGKGELADGPNLIEDNQPRYPSVKRNSIELERVRGIEPL